MSKKPKPNIWQMEGATDLEKINVEWPEHDRTSCNDQDLYNQGTVFLRHRCDRCEALSQLRYKELRERSKQAERVLMTDAEIDDLTDAQFGSVSDYEEFRSFARAVLAARRGKA